VEQRERVLALQGGRNFRDLGGYETKDGRRLKWGKLYRSGAMGGLTEDAYDQLAALGIRFICDFRTNVEREESPTRWDRIPNLDYWFRDYQLSFGDLRSRFRSGELTVELARESMNNAYRKLPYEQAPAYIELFRRISEGDLPLIFNCSAGKDRTGVAAALILSALGVPDETILDDYLLTNSTLDRQAMLDRPWMSDMSKEVALVMLSVEPDYIKTTLTTLREAHGTVPGFLEEKLGVTPAHLARIQEQLLE
jgi:protein-tyrosine phosphatase